jgi:hypothetical protein
VEAGGNSLQKDANAALAYVSKVEILQLITKSWKTWKS